MRKIDPRQTELKDFVRQSLLEITEAILEANAVHKSSTNSEEDAFFLQGGPSSEQSGIHFDVAVTSRSEGGAGGKVRVGIKVVELSAEGDSQKGEGKYFTHQVLGRTQ